MATPFHLIVAFEKSRGIGLNNNLPWKLKKDMAWFKQVTTHQFRTPDEPVNAVIMGYNTWRSIPAKFRPFKDRLNIVLAREKRDLGSSEVIQFNSLSKALVYANKKAANTFVIGGAMVFAEALKDEDLVSLFATEIDEDYNADQFFPKFDKVFSKKKTLFEEEEKVGRKIVKFSMVQYGK